jgi:hypothetical protein
MGNCTKGLNAEPTGEGRVPVLLITMHHHHPLRFHTRHTQPEDGEKINVKGYKGVKCGANI